MLKTTFALLLAAGMAKAEIPDSFFNALAAVESSGNPKAYNKKEKAIGIYQIRPAYFADAQKANPELRKYRHDDCYRPEVAKKAVKAYMSRYCKGGTLEDMARAHNAGWNWKNKKQLTNNYWQKVKKNLTGR